MAVRKPLVLVGGEIQQLQAGDTLAGPFGEVDTMSATNADVGAHALGDVVYVSGNNAVKKARADAVGTKNAVALAMGAIGAGTPGSYQTDGIIGGLTGLVADTVYYLSQTTAGALTAVAPSAVGQYVVRIGIAISTTELELQIQRPILL